MAISEFYKHGFGEGLAFAGAMGLIEAYTLYKNAHTRRKYISEVCDSLTGDMDEPLSINEQNNFWMGFTDAVETFLKDKFIMAK